MGQNIVELGFNVAEFTAEQKVVYDGALQVYELLQKMDGFKINLGSTGGFTELKEKYAGAVKAMEELKAQAATMQKEIDNLKKANLDAAQAQQKVIDITKQSTQATKENATETKKTAAAAQQQIDSQLELLKLYSRNEVVIKQLVAAKKELAREFKAGTITEDEYLDGLSKINEQQIATREDQRQLILSLRNIDKALVSSEGSLNSFRAELVLLQQAYANLSNEEKASPIGKEIEERANKLANVINEQQQKVGDFTKNIGRYAESLGPGFEKVSEEISRLKLKGEELKSTFQNLSNSDRGGDIGFKLTGQIKANDDATQALVRTQQIGFKTNQSYAQSLNTLSEEYVQLKQSGTQSEEFLKEFSEFILKAKADLKLFQAEVSNSKTTNYTGAVNTLKTALQQVTEKVTKLTAAQKLDTEEGKAAVKEKELLTVLVGQQEAGFVSLTREVMANGQALVAMREAGLEGTEAYQKLQEQYVEAKQKLHEFNNEQKILTNSAPKLAALTAAAKGLSGIYAAGAGAAALFAGDNEHVAHQLQKLVAVMTLLHGLEEIHELLQKKNAIATALFGTATVGTTVALEGEAVAATQAGVATSFFGKALAFIEANPVVLALTALVAIVIAVTSSLEDQEDQLKETQEAAAAYSKTLNDLTEAQTTANKFLTGENEKELKRLEDLRSKAESQGATKAYILSLDKQILEVNKKIADDNAKAHPDLKKNLEDESISLAHSNSQYKTQLEYLDKLNKMKEDGIKISGRVTGGVMRGGELQGGHTETVDEAIKAQQKLVDQSKKTVDATQQSVDSMQKIKDDQLKADLDLSIKELEISKLSADEQRKLALATAQLEVAEVQNKNNLIISNEQSSFEERIAAMKSNQQALKDMAKADRDNILTDPEKSGADKLIAQKQYWAQVGRVTKDGKVIQGSIEREGNETIRKETKDYNNRLLQLKYDEIKMKIEADADGQELISRNTKKTNEERLAAYNNYFKDQEDIINANFNFQKEQQGLSDAAIVAKDKEKQEKLLLLTSETNGKLVALYRKRTKDIFDIVSSQDSAGEEHRKSAHETEMARIQNEYDQSILALDKKFYKNEISEKEYNKRKLRLQANLQIALLQSDIEFTKETIAQFKLRTEAQEKALQAEIDAAEIRAKLNGDEAALKRVADAKEELKALHTKNNDIIAASDQKLAALQIKLGEVVTNFLKKKSDDTKKSFEETFSDIADIAKATFDIIGGFVNANVAKQKNAIQELIDANALYSQQETERINNSTLSEEDKAAKLIQLKAEVDAKDKMYAQEQKKRDIEKAKFDKAATIAKIILDTTLAVMHQLNSGDPYTAFGRAVAAGIVGAAQLAVAIATPVATYAEGTESHPGGPAVVGERKDKVPELVQEPGGKSYVADKPTLIKNLPRGSRVIPLTQENLKQQSAIDKEHSMVANSKRADDITRIINNKETLVINNLRQVPAYKDGIGVKNREPLPGVKNNTTINNNEFSSYVNNNSSNEETFNDTHNSTSIRKDIHEHARLVIAKPGIKQEAKKVTPLTNEMINEAMFRAGSEGMAHVVALAEFAEKKRESDARKLAQWQTDKIVAAIEKGNNKKSTTRVNVINDFGWIDYLNKKVFGRTG